MKSKLLLGLALVLSGGLLGASAAQTNREPQSPTHIWEYINYSRAGTPQFLLSSGEQWGQVSRGLRVDIMGITPGFGFFKTNAIVARMYRANGEIVEPTPEGGKLLNSPISTSWAAVDADGEFAPQVMTYFPWGTNALEEAWIEVIIGPERYWVEIPYGFDRNSADPPPAAVPGGPPRVVAAMKSPTEHDHVVRWQQVQYDLGRIQNGWSMRLNLSNSTQAEAEVLLYKDPDEAIKSPWNTNSPQTAARIFDADGAELAGRYINTRIDDGRFWRTDTFHFDRDENNLRSWGRIAINVDDKVYQVSAPSSLYKYDHGHSRQIVGNPDSSK